MDIVILRVLFSMDIVYSLSVITNGYCYSLSVIFNGLLRKYQLFYGGIRSLNSSTIEIRTLTISQHTTRIKANTAGILFIEIKSV